MTLHFEPLSLLVVGCSCLVGWIVYRRPQPDQPGERGQNLTESIAAIGVSLLLFGLLFGGPTTQEAEPPLQVPTVTAPDEPRHWPAEQGN